MLQLVDHKPASLIDAFLTPDDTIARCSETGATLEKSRRQYTLIAEDVVRHWSRRKVTSDQEAIERANKSLMKIVQEAHNDRA
jgi:hypothetical protein